MPDPAEHTSASRPLGAEEAAASLSRWSSSGRPVACAILYALIDGERHVDDLASLLGLSANTISQQLRVLRAARAVRVRRDGRRAYYALHDSHVVDLLASIRHHAEHTS